ncbi:MAG: hypothetical protein DCF15_00165 [Phormidesmis priestleyi]|uniref:Phosphoenolpyruvate protein kinase n=1 Tax=Phormidesmis priestleyi TaxID=268141 RepID=A0A2W4ZRU3_9CYAN|nr:MAG: hypothetical protein DCF15_00165 [Phormidesmis priestleyi]
MRQLKIIYFTATQKPCRTTALRVALIVGTILLTINHGSALIAHKMSYSRWVSALLTYMVPFIVSIHGQSTRQILPEERRW